MTVSDRQKVALVVGAGAVVWLMTRKHTLGEVPIMVLDDPHEPGDKKDKRADLEALTAKLQEVAKQIYEWNERRQVLFGELQQANATSQRKGHVDRLEALVTSGNELFANIKAHYVQTRPTTEGGLRQGLKSWSGLE